jgi:predicted O-methyltransferase YrrM
MSEMLENEIKMKKLNILSGSVYKTLQSHFMQIYLAIKLKAKDVLEIGKENGFVSDVLKYYCNITTLDFQDEFNPDLLIDITDLEQLDTLKDNNYDLILLC